MHFTEWIMADQKQGSNEENISLPAEGNLVLLAEKGEPTAIATPTGVVSKDSYFTDIHKLRAVLADTPGYATPYKNVEWGGESALIVSGDTVSALRKGNAAITKLDSPEAAQYVRGLLAAALHDGTTAAEEAKLNYTIDDIMDNGRLDHSVPQVKSTAAKER